RLETHRIRFRLTRLSSRLHGGQTGFLSACSRSAGGSLHEVARKSADGCQYRGLELHENLPQASRDSLIIRSSRRCNKPPHERTALDSASPACLGRQCTLGRCRRGRLSSWHLLPCSSKVPTAK